MLFPTQTQAPSFRDVETGQVDRPVVAVLISQKFLQEYSDD